MTDAQYWPAFISHAWAPPLTILTASVQSRSSAQLQGTNQKQPLFAAFVDLKKAYDNVHHPLLWASLQRKGIHGKMLAGIQSLYDGGDISMEISGSSGASGTARVGVRQGCPLSPTLFGIFFDSLDAQLQAESAAAGVECRGARVPGLFYADDVALLAPSSQGLQQLLDTMQALQERGVTLTPEKQADVNRPGNNSSTRQTPADLARKSVRIVRYGHSFSLRAWLPKVIVDHITAALDFQYLELT